MMTEEQERALRHLSDTHGGILKPCDVVAAATPVDSVLHDLFDWDDSEAARKWRENQARGLIQRLRITQVTEVATYTTIAFVRDPDLPTTEQGYRSIDSVREDRDASTRVLRNELDRIVSLAFRTQNIAQAVGRDRDVQTLLAEALRTRDLFGGD